MGCQDGHRRKGHISVWKTPNGHAFTIVEPQEHNARGELLCDKALVESSLLFVQSLIDQQSTSGQGAHRLNAHRVCDSGE